MAVQEIREGEKWMGCYSQNADAFAARDNPRRRHGSGGYKSNCEVLSPTKQTLMVRSSDFFVYVHSMLKERCLPV